jgi:hypothetical protein
MHVILSVCGLLTRREAIAKCECWKMNQNVAFQQIDIKLSKYFVWKKNQNNCIKLFVYNTHRARKVDFDF